MTPYNYFDSKFNLKESSGGWYRFSSPFDTKNDKSAAVNFSLDLVKDFRNGFRGSIYSFVKKTDAANINNLDFKSKKESKLFVSYQKTKNSISLPKGFKFLDDTGNYQNAAIDYVQSRGLDLDLLYDLSVGYVDDADSDFFGKIVFPFMNPDLMFYYGRDFIGGLKHKFPKKHDIGIGKSDVIYNENALFGDMCYVCEGVFDALSCGVYGVALLGWSWSKQQVSKLNKSKSVKYIIPDAGFFNKALIQGLKLLGNNFIAVNVDSFGEKKDVNDIGLDKLVFKPLTIELYK